MHIKKCLKFIALLVVVCGQGVCVSKDIDAPPIDTPSLLESENPEDSVASSEEIDSSSILEKPEQSIPQKNRIQPMIEFKVGYFFFSNNPLRDVQFEGGLDLQIAGSYPIWRWIQIYGSVEYMEKHGRSLSGNQKTKIREYPLSLGVRAVAEICKSTQYYFTIGPRYFFVHVHNYSSFVDRRMNQNGIGGFAGMGFNFLPIPHLLIDIFGEYSYCRLHFHSSKKNTYSRDVQVGGFTFGGGIGYSF